MRCISKITRRIAFVLSMILFVPALLGGCAEEEIPPSYASIYEKTAYNRDLYRGSLFAEDLCVASADVPLAQYAGEGTVHAAGLFDLSTNTVLYADRIHDRLSPASTTKVLTAYVALKYGNPDDMVTVSERIKELDPESSLCGIEVGDQLSLYDLLCGLLLSSGNDAAVTIAEYISGSEEAFVQQMNAEALLLGATNSHFVNSHGLHDEDHYTTAYDLYLIFNAALKDSRFLEILSLKEYTPSITGADGSLRTPLWTASNYYSAGEAQAPEGIRVVGGKTGTTDEAGNCVILYNEDLAGSGYISVIMGEPDKTLLYEDMSKLLTAGILP